MRISAAFALLIATMIPCASEDAAIAVTSHPADAKVYVNGYFKARAPATVTIGSGTVEVKPYLVTLHLPGFKKWIGRADATASPDRVARSSIAARR